MNDSEAEKLILVRFTNPYQIRYAKDDSGSFYPDTENGRLKALYMLKRHENRLHTGEQLAPTVACPVCCKSTVSDKCLSVLRKLSKIKINKGHFSHMNGGNDVYGANYYSVKEINKLKKKAEKALEAKG